MAEREGFEPPVPEMGTIDFESTAFDHSAISPMCFFLKIKKSFMQEFIFNLNALFLHQLFGYMFQFQAFYRFDE